MIDVSFHERAADELLKFAVIIAKTEGKWVFCKHRERDTWEFPGGHREEGETILAAEERELKEETGALKFTLQPVCAYSVKGKTTVSEGEDDINYGMLFTADITAFEDGLHSEIETIMITDRMPERWTYPLIQPKLLGEAAKRGFIDPA